MTRSDLDRALFHADPLPYQDGADEHDHELATLAADRASEHTGIDHTETRMTGYEESKLPCPTPLTIEDFEDIVIPNLLAGGHGDQIRRLMVVGAISNSIDDAKKAHRARLARTSPTPIKRVSEMGTVLPLRPDHAA